MAEAKDPMPWIIDSAMDPLQFRMGCSEDYLYKDAFLASAWKISKRGRNQNEYVPSVTLILWIMKIATRVYSRGFILDAHANFLAQKLRSLYSRSQLIASWILPFYADSP